ncbi:Putative short-chain dehydrogenase/reductase SDR, NAD(P)-binding domain superfamily [Septoria linicola]|uniref:Short-chain dehydrogenase/reductase SDR, NAD(P)-binding domain superfamily n=1 Tax=Septoria linicola TaxID=215465 RepID=A0A9Q9EHM1_9PEZI|nr:Putative short-chain dehydrogenase/reductase SDR, NAD(P)-binding domain superfamily [Septoria linicola]
MALSSSRQLLDIFQSTFSVQPLLAGFASLGALSAAYALARGVRFLTTHFLKSDLSSRYCDEAHCWALVTGASDGLGRGFAEELLSHGFNVILHGRNHAKLERVKVELIAQWPARDIDIVVLDAMKDVDDPTRMMEAIRALCGRKIKILINNVAGELHPLFLSHAEGSAERNRRLMNGNFIFATELTRLLLPQLIENKPSHIMNIGSGSANLPCPYIAVAAASKSFLASFSKTLAAEMVAEGHPEVEVLYNLVGLCSTNSEPRSVTFLVPSSRQFAKSSLKLIGHGHRSIWGYWPHALQFETLFLLPTKLVERLCIGLVRDLRAEYDHRRKEA